MPRRDCSKGESGFPARILAGLGMVEAPSDVSKRSWIARASSSKLEGLCIPYKYVRSDICIAKPHTQSKGRAALKLYFRSNTAQFAGHERKA